MLPRPEVLRQNLREQLDSLPDEGIVVLHNFALELQLRAAWSRFSDGLTADWASGKYERLDEALREARQALRSRGAT